ncbi:Uncharacterized protein TCM_010894 [Theobroma cacao]|uniref:Uncharacterized protein n=1 Tax=Theobroma cacao TaxID=3641 RepID=A0A061EFC7_THECC|nr:Uncharacterized protein TCM_010894 [Theobroma cacao]
MINTLSEETKDWLSILQGEFGELKAQVNLLIITIVECRHRAALNAICTTNVEAPRAQILIEVVKEESACMGYIRFFSVLQVQLEKMKKEPQQGFMYVDVLVNEKKTKAMLNIKASDTFITSREVEKYGLKVEKDFEQRKTVNSPASAIVGNSKDVKVKIGSWKGKVKMALATIDDLILSWASIL